MQQQLLRPIRDLFITTPVADAIVITGIYGFHQWEPHSCGAAVVATALDARKGDISDSEWDTIARLTRPDAEGTTTERLTAAVKGVGLNLRKIRKPLHTASKEALLRGNLIITTVRMPRQPASDTHWVVVVGWRPDGLLILNCTGLPMFTKRWYSWRKLANAADAEDEILEVYTEVGSWVSDLHSDRVSLRKVS